MSRILVPVCDSINIYSYGLCIALAVVVVTWFIQKHDQFKKLNLELHFSNIVMISFLAALVGGRILYCLELENTMTVGDFFAIWEGGFSVLGSIIGVCFVLPFYLVKNNIPPLPFFDLIALHAPLLQSLSRFGCFFAGCCYGKETNVSWGVTYSDAESLAPLHKNLHPAQLYSVLALLIIFVVQYFVLQKIFRKSGQMAGFYLMAIGAERFLVEYFRGDATYYENFTEFSVTQSISVAIFVSGLLLMAWASLVNNRSE